MSAECISAGLASATAQADSAHGIAEVREDNNSGLVDYVVGQSIPALDRELPRAGGNPLLVIELAQHMDRWSDDNVEASSSLPVSLRENILGRLTFLSDRCRRVLRSAAILGPEVDLDMLSIVERTQSRTSGRI